MIDNITIPRAIVQQALEALEEATSYTSCPTWSPSMTKECETAAATLRTSLEQQQQAEALQAMNDQLTTGTSIMLDGKRVDPASVYKQAERWLWIFEDRHGDRYTHKNLFYTADEAAESARICGVKAIKKIDSSKVMQQAEPDRRDLQAAGTHPAPCARHCEAKAFEIEIRGLKSQLKQQAEPVESSTRLPRWVVVFEEEAKKPLSVIGLKRDDINQAVRDYKLMQDLYESVANIRDAPPQRQWVELTSDEIADIAIQSGAYDEQLLTFARFTEAKLKEKNT